MEMQTAATATAMTAHSFLRPAYQAATIPITTPDAMMVSIKIGIKGIDALSVFVDGPTEVRVPLLKRAVVVNLLEGLSERHRFPSPFSL